MNETLSEDCQREPRLGRAETKQCQVSDKGKIYRVSCIFSQCSSLDY